MKKRAKELTDLEKIRTLDTLYTAASAIKGRDAVKLFLRDLLTESERIMLGRRILIARLLMQGEDAREIVKRLGVGMDTIYRVQRWLEDQLPGFENAIKEMEKEFERRKIKYSKPEILSNAWLKKKYPLHFLFFPTPKKKKATEFDE